MGSRRRFIVCTRYDCYATISLTYIVSDIVVCFSCTAFRILLFIFFVCFHLFYRMSVARLLLCYVLLEDYSNNLSAAITSSSGNDRANGSSSGGGASSRSSELVHRDLTLDTNPVATVPGDNSTHFSITTHQIYLDSSIYIYILVYTYTYIPVYIAFGSVHFRRKTPRRCTPTRQLLWR